MRRQRSRKPSKALTIPNQSPRPGVNSPRHASACGCFVANRFAYRGHHDANHGELAKVFEDLGCSVADTSAAGFGFPDIVLGLIGQTHLVEIKDADGQLSASQKRFIRDWRGSPIVVVQTIPEAIERVQRIRRNSRG